MRTKWNWWALLFEVEESGARRSILEFFKGWLTAACCESSIIFRPFPEEDTSEAGWKLGSGEKGRS